MPRLNPEGDRTVSEASSAVRSAAGFGSLPLELAMSSTSGLRWAPQGAHSRASWERAETAHQQRP